VPVVPFGAEAGVVFQQLVQQKLRIGTQDVRIAAIVLTQQAMLVTSNRRHFDQVPGLLIEDWNE
jgi:tRNA(fMet)-specific endonuclease VapC